MSGQNFDEINQILKKLKNNNRGISSCEHYTSSEPKSSCPPKPSREPKSSCPPKPSGEPKSSCPPKPSSEPKSSYSPKPKKSHHLTKDCQGNVKITGDLTVCEDICVGNALQVNTILAKGDIEPVCVNSVLQVDNIAAKDSNITIQDNVSICGKLQVDVISAKSEGPLEIKSDTQINESLCVQNNLYTNNIYAIESKGEDDEVVNINDNTNIDGDLCVQNNIIVDSIIPKSNSCVNVPELSVENIKFTSNNSTCETGNITGNVSLRNDLYVNGTITSCSGIKTNNLTVGGQLTLCDKLKVPDFEVCGNTTLGNKTNLGDLPKTQVNGDLCISNRLEVWNECDSTSDKVIIEQGNVCIDGNLQVDVIKAKDSSEPVCIDGDLVISNNCNSNDEVKISDGCVDAHAFVGQVGVLNLDSSSSDDVANYTSLIVTGTDSTDDGNLSLNNAKEGQILVVINESSVNLKINSVTIIPESSRVIVYYENSWH